MYKVMIADDEPMVRKGLIHLINWQELDCELAYVAEDGKELIDNIDRYDPDIIICDIKMPRVDGIEVARYIWEHDLRAKVTLLTAYADFQYAQSAIQYGVVQYVTKTGALDGIIDAIEKSKDLIKRARLESNHHHLDKDLMKLNIMKSIIDSSLYNIDEIKKNAIEYDISLQKFLALAVKLETDQNDDHLKSQMHTSLSNIFTMALSDSGFESYTIPMAKDMFCIIINSLHQNYKEKIQTICSDIVDTVHSFMNESVYIGISEPAEGPYHLNATYQQATSALSRRFLDEQIKIYPYTSITQVNNTYSAQIEMLIEQISLEIQKGMADTATEYLEQLFSFQKTNQLSEIDIKNVGILIENKCRKFVAAHHTTLSTIYDYQSDAGTDISDSVFFSQYSDVLTQIVLATCEFMLTVSKGRNNIIIDALHYIDNHFKQDITLNDIANHINVNSSYLSRLFKEKTGDTIINTINHKKIERAKDSLRNTDKKIYEIAEEIGIDDTSYFSHFFKKYTGVSPKQYKGSYNKEMSPE
ncbi:response regulator [Paenibacillus segetis]|uniref:DNA-binding response regulator n=1 Tax=Paenibacillus segetis TaxID=1325360 RepID=A0ABQ1YM25_9BACL|nr:response regulator [Paenibacillus segetis]GGH29111.1 DNA-binding response regulator [Paenibacillus segetis]